MFLIKNNSVFLAHTFFHPFFTSCEISSLIEPEQQQQNYGKQVLSCQSQTRLEQERTGLNRLEHLPCQPLIYIQYTLHPTTFAQQLCSQFGLTTEEVKREGEGITHALPSALIITQGHAAGLPRADTPILHSSQEHVLTITERRLQIVLARGVGQEREPSERRKRLQGPCVPMAAPAHNSLLAQWMCMAGA